MDVRQDTSDSLASGKKQRMCWNCEGMVGFDAYYCPYCGTDVSSSEEGEPVAAAPKPRHKPLEESLASLYKPPYISRASEASINTFSEDELATPTEREKRDQGGVWSLLLLSIGSVLLTLGLLLFFFSDQGRVVLQWNAHYWFLYCLGATPLLVLGWRLLQE